MVSFNRNRFLILIQISIELICITNSSSDDGGSVMLTQLCDSEILLKVETPVWYGDLIIHPQISSNGIDLNLVLHENIIDLRGGLTTFKLLKGQLLNLNFNAVYDNHDSDANPSLKEIQLNGRRICAGVSGVIVETQQTEEVWVPQKQQQNYSYYDFVETFNKESECGTVIAPIIPFIHNGNPILIGEFPWHATIFQWVSREMNYLCGGTLIDEGTVITAAHCVTRPGTKIALLSENLMLYLGKEFLYMSTPNEQSSPVEKLLVHHEFEPSNFYSDIAVIRMKYRITPTIYVNPICLWTGTSDLNELVERAGTIPGFGLNEKGELSTSIAKVKMPVVSMKQCLLSKPHLYGHLLLGTSFCAGFRNGSSVCNGDSGGGMVFEENSHWFLRGIVSFGQANLDDRYSCDTHSFVVFTDVAKFTPWIKENLL